MSKNFSDLHKATLEREKTMKEDLKKTHEVLHIMQGSIEETLTSHVGEIDAQKKHIDLVQKEVIKMRSDTSEALHLLAKKMNELTVKEGGIGSPSFPGSRAHTGCGPTG